MTNYNESTNTTIAPYRRVRYIGITNPPIGMPQVNILEADAVVLNGKKLHLDEGVGGLNVVIDLDVLSASFPLRNPNDDSLLGSDATGAALMAILYSWVRSQQNLRDIKG